MFTGLYETQNAILSKDIGKISPKIPVLSEILKDLGYLTLCYNENPWINKETGLSRGFEVIFERINVMFRDKYLNLLHSILRNKIKNRLIKTFWELLKRSYEHFKHKFTWKRIIFNRNKNSFIEIEKFYQENLDNISRKPIFLFFNIMATHSPYFSTKNILEKFGINIEDFRAIKELILYPIENIFKINLDFKNLGIEKRDVLKKFYNSSVIYGDLIVKYILLKLRVQGLLENSYVIITSDHGELLCDKPDHYYWTHGVFHSVYDSLIRIPLIIYNPNLNSKIVKKQVELKDIFHTILHLTGIPKEKNEFLNIKKSILHQINNNSMPEYVFGEYKKKKKEMIERINFQRRTIYRKLIPKILNNIYYLRSSKFKLIKYGNNIEEFYDLINDPYEQNSITGKNDNDYRQMKQILENFIRKANLIEDLKEIVTIKEKLILEKNVKKMNFEGI
jgi:arylsulfatase A-like enzyme